MVDVLYKFVDEIHGYFRGDAHVSNEAAGLAYSKAAKSCLSGQVFF